MIDFIPTLVSLFGSISAIFVAIILFLYDAILKNLQYNKNTLLDEIRNSLDCTDINENTLLKEGHNFYDDMYERVSNKNINLFKLDILIKYLLLKSFEKDMSDKLSNHLQRYHYNCLYIAREDYQNSLKVYGDFPTSIMFSIRTPLIITVLFILMVKFSEVLLIYISSDFLDFIIITISVLSILKIYYNCEKLFNLIKQNKKH